MTRREAREQAFCLLFEQAVSGCGMEEIIAAAAEARDLAPNSFTEELAYGVEENQEKLDAVISGCVRGWNPQAKSHRPPCAKAPAPPWKAS